MTAQTRSQLREVVVVVVALVLVVHETPGTPTRQMQKWNTNSWHPGERTIRKQDSLGDCC